MTSRRWTAAAACLCAGAAAPAVPSLLGAQQARQSRNCIVDIDSAGRAVTGASQYFAGGGFLAHCRAGQTTMSSDSVEWYADRGELHLIGTAHFRDSVNVLDSDRLTYWTRQERLYAEGHVYTRNLKSGSDLRGPNLDYYRAVPPIRDTLELFANGRPTIRLHPSGDSAAADTTNPFVIVADRVKLRHTDRFWGSGNVTIDRRDMRARSDSALLNLADSLAWLIGAAKVVGRDTARPAADTTASYTLLGQRIRFDLNAHRDVRRARSFRDADARGPEWHLVADTIDMQVDSNRIQRAQAWGTQQRPIAVSGLSTIIADSLDILMPDQVMRQVWAFRSARAVSRADSTVIEDDWISGDSLRARFARIDSAGTTRSEVEHVDAFGSARALYHIDNDQDPKGMRGINYSRGQRINIAMHSRKVRTVDIVGQVDGVYLEPVPDTSRVDSLRPGSAGRDSARADTATTQRPRAPTPTPAPATPRPGSPAPAGELRDGTAPLALRPARRR